MSQEMKEKAVKKFRENHRVDTHNVYPHVIGESIRVGEIENGLIWVIYEIDNGRSVEERGTGYDPTNL